MGELSVKNEGAGPRRARSLARKTWKVCAVALAAITWLGCDAWPGASLFESERVPLQFRVAVIPDTQNYVDYSHQRAEGFALDASELFLEQMREVAGLEGLAFVASVGDVWQHQSLPIDAEHEARGIGRIPNRYFESELAPTPKALEYEVPKAIEGYRILAEAGVRFGVAPGNHDYDAAWSVAGYPPNLAKDPSEITMTAEDLGVMHVGGLDNFRSAFGEDSDFFRGKSWYVASHNGGSSSAQVFEGAGYRFLHMALEMAASDEVLAWAAEVVADHEGWPTIVTTHDYLDARGRRRANPIVDLPTVDPEYHNTAEQVFQKFIAEHDQIFLVLCGHHHGQSRRFDENRFGHGVHQLLADYQDRGQVGIDAGQPPGRFRGRPAEIGDGWYRILEFDFATEPPRISVRTRSSHYRKIAPEVGQYAAWYREHEQPDLSDAEFMAEDHFDLMLDDFRARFGPGAR